VSRIDVDHCAASDFPFEDPPRDRRNLRETDYLRRPGKLAGVEVARQTRPGLDTDLLRGIDRVDAGKGDVAQG
jgi:hypothetical protein